MMSRHLLLAALLAGCLQAACAATPAERAQAMLGRMSFRDKIRMLHGSTEADGYVGLVEGNTELGIPDIRMNDGPQGFRAVDHPGTTTQWPSSLAIAATWNETAAYAWGRAMGAEFKAKGCDIQLGPAVNVARIPRDGRNYEYISGEDPHLGSVLAPAAIDGIQSQGVMANLKHFILNNQEANRTAASSNVDERTLIEIYARPFWAAVTAGNVRTVMCSYNSINHVHACENFETLRTILKGYMNFTGWVMSDWFATHTSVDSAANGLDMEMPYGLYFDELLEVAVARGLVGGDLLDEKVLRILTTMYGFGMFDRPKYNGTAATNVTSDEHTLLAEELALGSAVLLKNENGLLPLQAGGSLTIAVFGKPAHDDPVTGSVAGSGKVVPASVVTVLAGIEKTGAFSNVSYYAGADAGEASRLAQAADVCVVVLATNSKEGHDRETLALPAGQVAVAKAVAAANPRAVALIVAPGPVTVDWDAAFAAVLLMVNPGQQEGAAFAKLILGEVSPSGRLPFTIPNSDNEMEMTPAQYPGIALEVEYSEKLNVGYRWYNAHNVRPKYPFGHGLSWVSVQYSALAVDPSGLSANVTVTNTSPLPGADVCQLYVSFPAAAGEPPMQLKGFKKVFLPAGGSETVRVPVGETDLSVWNVSAHAWQRVHGNFTFAIGRSSQDMVLSATVAL